MSPRDLVSRIAQGFDKLFEHDHELFDLGMRGVNEQTITFRLGLYFYSLFPDHHVDCEYNRIWDRKKACALVGVESMEPDVIIHRRQSDRSNLFCLEAKKEYLWAHPRNGFDRMRTKLMGLTHPEAEYRYTLGLAWKIAPSANRNAHRTVWFLRGNPTQELSLVGFEDQLLQWMAEDQ
jgi:hypothetical protein